MKKIFFTFGGGGEVYRQAAQRLGAEVEGAGVFDQVHRYSDLDFFGNPELADFVARHGAFIAGNPRGYGYWLWKSYLFLKEFEWLDDGDVVVYADAGCELNPETRYLSELIDYAAANRVAIGDVRSPLTKPDSVEYLFENGELMVDAGHDHYTYTKMDLLQKFPALENCFDRQMCGATVIGMCKSPETIALVEAWYELAAAENYRYIDDSPSVAQNHPRFFEHRHDQSIFSLLVHQAGLDSKFTSLVYLAFIHIRNRSGKNGAFFNRMLTQSFHQQIPEEWVRHAHTSSASRFSRSDRDPYVFIFAGIRRFFFAPTALHYAFHTERESMPFWECSFTKPLFLDRLVIFNRPGYEDRALPMAVSGFDENGSPVPIMRVDYPFGGAHDKSPLVVELGSRLGRFTGLRLQVVAGQPTHFHLARIVVCVTPWGNQ